MGTRIKSSEVCKKEDIVLIPIDMIRDSRLSLEAKGILCYLLSLPCNFNKYSNEDISKGSYESIEIVNSSLDEIKKLGYYELYSKGIK